MIDLVNFKLIKDRLLIKPDSVQDKVGSIIIPEKFREEQEIGTVIAAGGGRRDKKTGAVVPMNCKVGSKVLFNKQQFEKLTLDSVEYYMLNDSEVLAVLS